jgi:hypothetical protein
MLSKSEVPSTALPICLGTRTSPDLIHLLLIVFGFSVEMDCEGLYNYIEAIVWSAWILNSSK